MASRLWSCETLVAGIPLLAEMDNTSAPRATDLQAKIEVTYLIRPKQSYIMYTTHARCCELNQAYHHTNPYAEAARARIAQLHNALQKQPSSASLDGSVPGRVL